VYGERDEPYTVISRLGQRLEATLAPGEILPTIVETVAGALRLPYAAIALDASGGLAIATSTGRPPADPLRMPLSYQGQPTRTFWWWAKRAMVRRRWIPPRD